MFMSSRGLLCLFLLPMLWLVLVVSKSGPTNARGHKKEVLQSCCCYCYCRCPSRCCYAPCTSTYIYAVPSMCNSFGQQAADLSFILLRETILFSLTQQYNQISPSISILGMIPRPAVCCPFCKIRCFRGKNYNSRHIWFN